MATTQRDILRQQRHAAMEHVARTNGGMVRWIGFGFVVALTVGLYAYEQTTAPRGCTRYYPFYVERSSIGPIARPVNDRDARKTLERFKLLGGTGCSPRSLATTRCRHRVRIKLTLWGILPLVAVSKFLHGLGNQMALG